MITGKDLADAAAALRELTGESQADFGRRIGYGQESVKRFESARFSVTSGKAMAEYAWVAQQYGRDDLFRLFSQALLESIGDKGDAILRRAFAENPVDSVSVPPGLQPMIRRLLLMIERPASDVEERLAKLIFDLLDPTQTKIT
jgi:transcriptional regulator with XRE-family HTH domain